MIIIRVAVPFKLLTEHRLEFLSLKGGCRGSSESTLLKMPHCRKSYVMAHLMFYKAIFFSSYMFYFYVF